MRNYKNKKNMRNYKNMENVRNNKNEQIKSIIFNGFEICEAEAEAGARPRRGRGGGGAAAPRRPRAAVINDAFPRPHANFQFFYSKSCF